MIIYSIELENFRQFRGCHHLDFSIDNDKNVTVVMGENGSGKTTLEQAFTWCLYGKTTFKDKQLLNREVCNTMPIGTTEQVKVEMVVHTNNAEFCIRRRQTVTKKSASKHVSSLDDFNVKRRNANGDWEDVGKRLQADSIVAEMLPEKLSGFFFFDGERIDKMSEDLLQKRKSDDFKEAVRALVGLNTLQAAMDRFGPDNRMKTVAGKLKSEMDDEGEGKIAELSTEINSLVLNIENNQNEQQKIVEMLDNVKKMLLDKEFELKNMQDSINNGVQYAKYQQKIVNEEKQQVADESECLKYFSKHIFRVLLLPLYKMALTEIKDAGKIDMGIPHIHSKTIEFLLNRGKCICGSDLHKNGECVKNLQELMYTLPPHSLGNMIGNFIKDIKINSRNADGSVEHFMQLVQNALCHDERIAEYHNEIKLLESKLPDQERVATLNRAKKDLETEQRKLQNDLGICRENIGRCKQEQERLERKRNTIISSSKRNKINKLYYEYAMAVYQELKSDYEAKEIATRENLEQVINDIFAKIYDNQIGITINNDYSVSTYLTDGSIGNDDLEKNTAQSYAVIFAFIAGIIKMHIEGKKAELEPDVAENDDINQNDGLPLVMDAPLSAFDKDRIKRICEELPKIAKQIIIFIKDTDGDIAEEHMTNIIGKKWLIKADSQTSSKILERN